MMMMMMIKPYQLKRRNRAYRARDRERKGDLRQQQYSTVPILLEILIEIYIFISLHLDRMTK